MPLDQLFILPGMLFPLVHKIHSYLYVKFQLNHHFFWDTILQSLQIELIFLFLFFLSFFLWFVRVYLSPINDMCWGARSQIFLIFLYSSISNS